MLWRKPRSLGQDLGRRIRGLGRCGSCLEYLYILNDEADIQLVWFELYAWGGRASDRIKFDETALKAVNTSFKPN
jgi:hypothetical protein